MPKYVSAAVRRAAARRLHLNALNRGGGDLRPKRPEPHQRRRGEVGTGHLLQISWREHHSDQERARANEEQCSQPAEAGNIFGGQPVRRRGDPDRPNLHAGLRLRGVHYLQPEERHPPEQAPGVHLRPHQGVDGEGQIQQAAGREADVRCVHGVPEVDRKCSGRDHQHRLQIQHFLLLRQAADAEFAIAAPQLDDFDERHPSTSRQPGKRSRPEILAVQIVWPHYRHREAGLLQDHQTCKQPIAGRNLRQSRVEVL